MTHANGAGLRVSPTSPTWDYDGTKATEREVADLLAGFVRAMKPEVVVETGTFTGTTTQRLSRALAQNQHGHLWTVENDPELALQYSELVLERTTFVDADSAAWALNDSPDEIDIAFVDCGEPEHRIEVAEALWPKTTGILAIHDSRFYPELEETSIEAFGTPSLNLPVVNGLLIWQRS